MGGVVFADPFRCRPWDLHDRFQQSITKESCRAEIASFSLQGQLVPAVGRPLAGDPDFDIEIICGARRLFVARHLNRPLLVDVRSLSDREAIIAMDIENRQRMDISPYERGLGYLRWLRGGHFRSQEDIADCLQVSTSQVSRLVKLAQLPSIVVDAFGNPAEIAEAWGLELGAALEDSLRRQQILRKARLIASNSDRPSARDVYIRLIAASYRGRRRVTGSRDQIVTDAQGHPVFRVRRQPNSTSILLPADRLSAHTLELLRTRLKQLLKEHASQGSGPQAHRGAGERTNDELD